MSNTVIQPITGRIVSGNPFGCSTVTNRYEITIAVDRNSAEMSSFSSKVRDIVREHWPKEDHQKLELLGHKLKWNLKEYKGWADDGISHVDYCFNRLLINISEEQSPLIVMPDGKGGWKPIEHSGMIKTGDYVIVELGLIPNSGKVNPDLHLKPNFIALVKTGEKVDLEQDTAKKRREMLLEEIHIKLKKSSDLVK